MTALTICNTAVHQDTQGRYSLNDLHRAAVVSGVTKDIRPNEWMALDQTRDLEQILITENPGNKPLEAKAGRYGGTYVVKELVYAYAMWISPKFHLAVIRAYDALVTGNALRPEVLIPAAQSLASLVQTLRTTGLAHRAALKEANIRVRDQFGIQIIDDVDNVVLEGEAPANPAKLSSKEKATERRQEQLKKLARYIAWAKPFARHADMLKRMHMTADDFRGLVNYAIKVGTIERRHGLDDGYGYDGTVYVLCGGAA